MLSCDQEKIRVQDIFVNNQDGRNQRVYTSGTSRRRKKEETVEAPLPEKKKRKLTATQLATLAEGRKKRWEKKHLKIDIPEVEEEVKEPVKEQVQKKQKKQPQIKEEYVSSDSTSSESSSDETDDTSVGTDSPPYSYSSATESTAVNTDSSGSPDSDSSTEKQRKNARSVRKMKNYILKRTTPYVHPTMRLFL